MAVVSSQIAEDRPLKDGRRLCLWRAVDAQGQHYMQHERLGPGENASARLAAWVNAINRKVASAELQSFVDAARVGEDVTTKPVVDVTREQAIRHVFRTLLPSDNPRDVARLLPIRDWLRANHTAAQIRTILGITAARLASLNSRLDAIAPAKDMILADKPDEL